MDLLVTQEKLAGDEMAPGILWVYLTPCFKFWLGLELGLGWALGDRMGTGVLIGVGAQSTLGGTTFLPEKYVWKINNARILHNSCQKN